MRTTVDLPDELLQRVKIHAATQGLTLKDVFAAGLEKELATAKSKEKGRHRPIPVSIEGVDWTFPLRTNAELFDAIERDEEE